MTATRPNRTETEALLTFLQEKVNSFVKWDLVRFFHDNPHAAETCANIAQAICRDEIAVSHELDALVADGVLERKTSSRARVYKLTSDPNTTRMIDSFVQACDDRDFRMAAIQTVIAGLS
ncbi:hypothetical protein FBR02_17575 [Anaerolineae bacterium CFX9]|jgi:hypothetical protein|nr:hypothetical protein [Anaerolineae bacterium CFX9]